MVFGLLVLGLIAVWLWSPKVDDTRERRALDVTVAQAGLRLEDYFSYRLKLIEDLGREWSQGSVASLEELQARATITQASFSGFQAINWVDAKGVIVHVAPYAANRSAVGRDVHATREAAEALEEARRSGRAIVSAPLTLFQGGTGVVVYAPVARTSSAVEGFVNGVFRTEDAVLDCLRPAFVEAYDVQISDGPVELFASQPRGDDRPSGAATARVRVGGRAWELRVAPRDHAPPSRRELTLLVLAVLLAGAVAATVRLASKRRDALTRSEARGRAIVDALPDLVVEARADGKVTAVHGGAQRELITPEVEEHLGNEIAEALRTSASHSFEVPVGGEGDQAERWLEVRVSSLAFGEGLALVRDVTDRHEAEDEQRRLETQLRHVQKMEAVGQLAGGIAHDFNNLMTAVIAHAELARASVEVDSEVREDLDQISHVARRATQLTQRLLMFSKREKGEPRPLSMVELVQGLQPMIRRLIRENIELRVKVGADPAWVLADASQLEQVVVNLTMNASDAMPISGRLDLEVHARAGDPSRGEPSGPCVELVVRDTGIGMTVSTRERLFEPYFTTKELGRGSGLGLAIVYGVVTHARGRIHVESTVGQGTTFRVVLPATAAPAQVDASKVARVEPGSGTVLLVEDDALVRRAAVRALDRAGYQVIEAEDGQQAVAALAGGRSHIRIVVSDLVMPVMGGRELIEWMSHNHADVPIVLVSGYAEDSHGLQGRVAGILAKPYSPAELTKAVRDALQVDVRRSF